MDVILDKAGQKGTGKWTVGHAVEMSVPLSVIGSAVEARILSSLKDERVEASKVLPAPSAEALLRRSCQTDRGGSRRPLRQQDHQLHAGLCPTRRRQQTLRLGPQFWRHRSIWRGGCIIRAHFLNHITSAYRRNPDLKNLILDPYFCDIIGKSQANWRYAIQTAVEFGVAVPAFSAALSYYDSYRAERLPANLLQAQRDYFGAHTYERVDKPAGEFFHTEWLTDQK